jgi:hypothetical protein
MAVSDPFLFDKEHINTVWLPFDPSHICHEDGFRILRPSKEFL